MILVSYDERQVHLRETIESGVGVWRNWRRTGPRRRFHRHRTGPVGGTVWDSAGRRPQFKNFRVVLRYNNATSYALAVSLLAQRIGGGAGVQAEWPKDLAPLSREQVKALQSALSGHGFDAGSPDGQAGPATARALRAYQRSIGLPPDGFPTQDLLDRLQTP